jgi:hypothetical protein
MFIPGQTVTVAYPGLQPVTGIVAKVVNNGECGLARVFVTVNGRLMSCRPEFVKITNG